MSKIASWQTVQRSFFSDLCKQMILRDEKQSIKNELRGKLLDADSRFSDLREWKQVPALEKFHNWRGPD